jgi:hypothetical protein
LIRIYFGLDCKNLLVNPILPLTINKDTISSIYPYFQPAKVYTLGRLTPNDALCYIPRSSYFNISYDVNSDFYQSSAFYKRGWYLETSSSDLAKYKAYCKNALVGFEEQLVIFIKFLIGIGGKGSKLVSVN